MKEINLTAEEERLLFDLVDTAYRGGQARPRKSAQRDRLQRLALVESAKGRLSGTFGSRYWRPTEAGRKYAEEVRR